MSFPQSAHGFSIRHLLETNSTNDDILQAIETNEPEGFVIVADRQLKGRGRQGRAWVTTPDSSLAFSILLNPTTAETNFLSRFSALAGLAVIAAIEQLTGARAWLKWPNDVLINGKKVCGILVEALWDGYHPKGLAIGIGINLSPDAIPNLPDLIYPASSLKTETGKQVDRSSLLEAILTQINQLRSELTTEAFIERCNASLAFKGQVVPIRTDTGEMFPFRLLKIASDGALIVTDAAGVTRGFYSAELSASSSSSTSVDKSSPKS